MSDLISRQAAIDAIERMILPQVKGETAAGEINRVAWRCAINCAEEMIGHLPSAQSQWIPCSERLPEKKQSLLVTVADEVSPYTSDDEWTGTGFWAYGKRVSAWMPLPKPYGGESE